MPRVADILLALAKEQAQRLARWRNGAMAEKNGHTPPAEEAAQQRINKSAKVQTALEAMLVDDLRRIGATERDAVNRYRESKLFGGGNGQAPPAGDSDLIVCDNMRIEAPKSNNGLLTGVLLGTVLAAGGALGLSHLNQTPAVQPPTQPVPLPPQPAGPAPVPVQAPAPTGVGWKIQWKIGEAGTWQDVQPVK